MTLRVRKPDIPLLLCTWSLIPGVGVRVQAVPREGPACFGLEGDHGNADLPGIHVSGVTTDWMRSQNVLNVPQSPSDLTHLGLSLGGARAVDLRQKPMRPQESGCHFCLSGS